MALKFIQAVNDMWDPDVISSSHAIGDLGHRWSHQRTEDGRCRVVAWEGELPDDRPLEEVSCHAEGGVFVLLVVGASGARLPCPPLPR